MFEPRMLAKVLNVPRFTSNRFTPRVLRTLLNKRSPVTSPCQQGALDALKLSQELLVRIHGQRQGHGGSADSPAAPVFDAHAATSTQSSGPRIRTGDLLSSRERPPEAAARTAATEKVQLSTTPSLSTDIHVHELTAEAAKLRGMSDNVKRLLQLAVGEVQGALDGTRESFGLATADDGHHRSDATDPQLRTGVASATANAVGTQTGDDVVHTREGVDILVEKLREGEAAARALEAENSRLEAELGKALGELASVQELLRDKAAQVGAWRSLCGVCVLF